ncbi:MAG: YgiQ family radical SAM protein [Candidatus Thermoplasmatota archaeon]|nr:YgiQ family radical SAM protein [Candidatus Thermoplasmatota archaeon]
MISKTGHDFDIIIITGEYYDDHPLSPVGVIARALDANGYRVGIIEKPETKNQFTCLGTPRLCFCVTAGSMDSMLYNYTPMKRKRMDDPYSSMSKMPNRAIIVYCNKIKQYFKSIPIVIGGIEASLRRFAHYDYWDNDLRRSIVFDSRATILVYGNGEKQILEIASRLKKEQDLKGIKGTCIVTKEIDETVAVLPSFKEIKEDIKKFCLMQTSFSMYKDIAQEYDNNYLLQYTYPEYTPNDLDWIYSLPYTRKLHPQSLLKMAKFSVVTHRGCIGKCNFCSLSLHQGDKIISRSEENILREVRKLTKHPEFKGYIDDLGGPSANMYGMDCVKRNTCENNCLKCIHLDKSHNRLISLLKNARNIQGVKKIFVRSGIRYDLALRRIEYIKELVNHHISGCLKIAPEHFSEKVTILMNKDNTNFNDFVSIFNTLNKGKKQYLSYYFMIGHPGDNIENVCFLKDRIKKKGLTNIEHFQLFTPTPMTVSTCMYWTGMNPFTLEKVDVIWDYKTKKKLKRMLLDGSRK